jgi:hypothetical protein
MHAAAAQSAICVPDHEVQPSAERMVAGRRIELQWRVDGASETSPRRKPLTIGYHARSGWEVIPGKWLTGTLDEDQYSYVLSVNAHRRHLTAEQKRDLNAKVLKAKPEASNRQIAAQVRTDDKTVGAVRRQLEATAELSQVEKTVGADDKARKKPMRQPSSEQHIEAAAVQSDDNPGGKLEFVSVRWRRDADSLTIAKIVLAVLKHQSHHTDLSPLSPVTASSLMRCPRACCAPWSPR